MSNRHADRTSTPPRWVKVFWFSVLVGVVAFAVAHLAGRGLGGHFQHGVHSAPAAQ